MLDIAIFNLKKAIPNKIHKRIDTLNNYSILEKILHKFLKQGEINGYSIK